MRTPSLLTRIAVFLALIAGSSDLALAASKQSAPVYYLALGDSLSVGAQPDLTGQTQPTNQGYADDLYAILLKRIPNLQLVKLGCIGETTGTMIDGTVCTYRSGSQLNEAVAFLNAHAGSVALVTIDLGANDLLPCIARGVIDAEAVFCINRAFLSIMTNLPQILSALRTTSAPVTIAAMNYYDPFLAAWLLGPAGQQLALQSSQLLLGQFNPLLGEIYAAFGVPVGDVAKAFHTGNFDAVVFVPGLGRVPLNVALVCLWTWMCTPPPQGANIHPNAVGYEVIAGAIFMVLPR